MSAGGRIPEEDRPQKKIFKVNFKLYLQKGALSLHVGLHVAQSENIIPSGQLAGHWLLGMQ